MGAILSSIRLDGVDALGDITPSRADWLTSHADATDLSAVEVERLWRRFQQVTGSRDKANLYPENNALPEELSNDIFVKNLLKHFPRLRTDDDAISFGYFISVMRWFDEANLHRKLEAIFQYLNNGDPIDATFLVKLFKHIHPDMTNDEIKSTAAGAMRLLGSTETDKLNQQQFVEGVLKFIPHDELAELLDFHIIPTAVSHEVATLPDLPLPPMMSVNADHVIGDDLVTDDQIKQLALQTSQKHWTKLILALGFLEYDIEAYKARNNYNAAATVYDLLDLWREQEGSLATKTRLREYLKISDFGKLVKILD
ncbi:unnamed protein product [Adineta ricciae]|uniref:Death domain-containing protein n=1 Tax=Adineta ricciae TaxID=249248 RepID=A0A813PVB3_ADIRI|nr:unnamed protein product [Adineta ricciae]CAF1624734.1 unnamed protein product [Adineta ricciae]